MYLSVRGIDFASFYNFSKGPWCLNELGRCKARVAQWVRSLDLTAHTSQYGVDSRPVL
jgi:hypothetical protein